MKATDLGAARIMGPMMADRSAITEWMVTSRRIWGSKNWQIDASGMAAGGFMGEDQREDQWKESDMAKPVSGMNQSLDDYVDHAAFMLNPVLFRHFLAQAREQAGSTYGRRT